VTSFLLVVVPKLMRFGGCEIFSGHHKLPEATRVYMGDAATLLAMRTSDRRVFLLKDIISLKASATW
jgi:hypothetical protein